MIKLSPLLKFACAASILAVTACTPKPAPTPPAPPPPAASTPTPPAPVARGPIPGSVEDFRVNVGDTVHFAYDAYNIEASDRGTLDKQASWLARYPSVRVTVEGHCDERGTREYNLALGARRANAVKEYLVAQGVSAARVETVSYGKERPVCTTSDDSCNAQNRRGATTITGGANS